MKLALATAAGQVCQRRSWPETVVPSPMSVAATRTSTVSICATGAGAGGGSDRLASSAAMPPATRAMRRTMIRAGFITLHFPHDTATDTQSRLRDDAPTDTWSRVLISAFKRQNMVNQTYPNRVNRCLLDGSAAERRAVCAVTSQSP